eukprot:g47608.t1
MEDLIGNQVLLLHVRKTSQAALLVLLEQELIDRSDVEVKVCPVLLDLTAPDSDDDYKIEAVAIICKMASILTGEITERLLLVRFCELCSDGKLFHVRKFNWHPAKLSIVLRKYKLKVCATNFGDISNTVGQEATEKYLIPRFFQLCSDNVWGIRKACAECFMAVSCSVSPEVRRTKLSPLFINLISDPSRWVRQAAFQSLGPFISTFANPSSAGLYIKEDGTLSIRQLDNSGADVRVVKKVFGLLAFVGQSIECRSWDVMLWLYKTLDCLQKEEGSDSNVIRAHVRP